MTPKHFSDRFCFYTIYLRKITQKNLKEKKKQFLIAPLSPGMQEHIAEHREKSEKSRNTCTKKYTNCILYNQKKRTYSQPQQFMGIKQSLYKSDTIKWWLNIILF